MPEPRMNRAGRRSDVGMTLVELLVAMIVFSGAMVMITSAVILTMRTVNEAQGSADAVFETRQALAVIDRQIRSGNVLFSPEDEDQWLTSCQDMGANSGSCMRIYTQANGSEKCVQWQVVADGGTFDDGSASYMLRMRSWESTWATGGSRSEWSVVARDLAMPTAPFVLEGASTPYAERLLQVHLYAVNTENSKPIAIDSSLSGRNTTYGFDTGQCTPPAPPLP